MAISNMPLTTAKSVKRAARPLIPVEIPTGGLGSLGNLTVPGYPLKKNLESTPITTKRQTLGLRSWLRGNTVGHDQQAVQLVHRPQTKASMARAMKGDNLHLMTIEHGYGTGGVDVKTVKRGVTPEQFVKVVGEERGRQMGLVMRYHVHGSKGAVKVVSHPVTLIQEDFTGRVVGVIDHLPGKAKADIWDRLALAIKENGGKILRKITRV